VKRVGIGVAAVLGLLAAAQVALPRLAESRLRSELAPTGRVQSVHVSAFPAVKLLWRHADSVEIRIGEAAADRGRVAELLDGAHGVGRLDATIASLRLGPLVVRDIALRKRGDRLTGEARVTRADLSAALPASVDLRPVEAAGGELVLQASAGPLAVRARLSARDGALVIAPDGLLGGIASLTVFDDPRVAVTAVGARPADDGYTLTAEGRLT
jgi:hypothetical protein